MSIFPWIFNFGGSEIIIILFVILLLFGGRKIPELMRGMGRGIREFNNARNSIEGEIREGMRDADLRRLEDRKLTEERQRVEEKREAEENKA
jgi:sec-independent protein translocase protein TatA